MYWKRQKTIILYSLPLGKKYVVRHFMPMHANASSTMVNANCKFICQRYALCIAHFTLCYHYLFICFRFHLLFFYMRLTTAVRKPVSAAGTEI